MATAQANKKSVSYRRNRNYRTQFTWTYELNKDLYDCYMKAREDPRKDYMNRMKNSWDLSHPELSYFEAKKLRQQAKYIIERGYILETQKSFNVANNNENEINRETPEGVHIDESIIVNVDVTNNEPTPSQEENIAPVEDNINKELYETLRRRLDENYNRFSSIETEMIEMISMRKKPNEEELKLINIVANVYLVNIKNQRTVTYEDINSLIYSSAVTLKEHLGKRSTKVADSKPEDTEPKWLIQLNERINRLRRDITHIGVVLECKQNNHFTNNQIKIQQRLRRKFGNTRRNTLIY